MKSGNNEKLKFAICALAAALVLLLPRNAKAEPPMAAVIGVAGEVEVQRSGTNDWIKAAIKMELFTGDKIRTLDSGKASILFVDGSNVKLNSLTHIEFQAAEADLVVVKITVGEIWSLLNPEMPKILRFESPAVNASVRGTEINIVVLDSGETILTVIEGQMLFANNYGSVVVADSQQSTAAVGKAPTPPKVVDTKLNIGWSIDVKSMGALIEARHFSRDANELTRLESKYNAEFFNNPFDYKNLLNRARARQDLKMYEKAKADYEFLKELTPHDPEPFNNLGEIYFDEGDLGRARAEFEKALEIDGDYIWASINLSMWHLWEEDWEKAEEYARKAVSIAREPEGEETREAGSAAAAGERDGAAMARTVLALALWRKGEREESIVELQRALEINPKFFWAHNRLAVSYLFQNKLEKAEEYAREAVRIEPLCAGNHAVMAWIYFYQKRLEDSKREASDALALDPDSAFAHGMLADLNLAQGRFNAALEHALKSIALDSKDPLFHNSAGIIYERIPKYAAAEKEYKRAIELDPRNPDFYTNLGSLYESWNKVDLAFEMADKALELDKNNATAYALRGLIYKQRLGEPDKAIIEYKKAIELEPEDAGFRSHIVGAYLNQNKLDEALKEALTAVSLVPESAEYHFDLADVYFHMGIYDSAVHELRQALNLDPDHAMAHSRLAYIYMLQGKYEESTSERLQAYLIDPTILSNPLKGNLGNELELSYGDRDAMLNNMVIKEAAKDKKLNFEIFAQQDKTSGFRVNSDHDNKRVLADMSFKPSYKTSFFFREILAYQNQGLPGPDSGWLGNDPDNRWIYKSISSTLGYRIWQNPRASFMMRIYWGKMKLRQLYPDPYPPEDITVVDLLPYESQTSKETRSGLEMRQDYKLGARHHLTLGAVLYRDNINAASAIRGIDWSVAPPVWRTRISRGHQIFKIWTYYFQDRFAVSNRLSLLLGFRADSHSYAGSALSPKFTVDYKLSSRTSLHFLYRGAFSSVVDVFLDPTENWYVFDENTYVEKDVTKMYQYELNILSRHSPSVFSRISFFKEDLKLYDVNAPTNISGKKRQYGLEIGVEKQFSRAISVSAVYTFTESKDKTSGAAFNNELPYHPREQAGITLAYFKNGFLGAVTARIKGWQYTNRDNTGTIPGWMTFDFRLSYEPTIRRTFYVECENILDKEYEDPEHYPQDPRSCKVGIQYRY